MPYACVTSFELLRFVTVIPATMRITLEETSLGQLILPTGKFVICQIAALHYDEKFWGDPKVFRSVRFLDDSGSLLPLDNLCRKRLLPFRAGTRVCVGEGFAMKRLVIFATSLVQAFEL